MQQRWLNGLLYLYLGGGFAYAWLLPSRQGAEGWSRSADVLILLEIFVAFLIGPMLLAATKGRPPGLWRLFTPGALLLQAAAYATLCYV